MKPQGINLKKYYEWTMKKSFYVESISPPIASVDFSFARVFIYFDLFPKFDVVPLTTKSNFSNASKQILSRPDIKKLIKMLEHYRDHPSAFNSSTPLSYLSHVTDFQKRVYTALCHIPFGKTQTYLDIAKELKSAPRAIGQACKRNPLPFIIPCHRVLAKHHLGGYAGACDGFFMNVKTALLKHEGINLDGNPY